MSIKLVKKTLQNKYFTFNVMAFLPSELSEVKSQWALFTHGYTANKADCINWAQRLVENNIPSVIFDLPGHYLGSYNDTNSFEEFRDHSHECFIDAYNFLNELLEVECQHLTLGGHSLGALLSMKALELDAFAKIPKLAIGVGLGIGNHKTIHLFESSFYEKTLQVRRQLVDENLDSDIVFPWIKEEKLNIEISNHRIHLICGLDDVVVGEGGANRFKEKLEENGNEVTLAEPRKLPHHEPSKAATHIFNFLKTELQ